MASGITRAMAAYSRRARNSVTMPSGINAQATADDREPRDVPRTRARLAAARPAGCAAGRCRGAAHDGLRQTTVCMARFSCRSNSSSGRAAPGRRSTGRSPASRLSPRPFKQLKRGAGEQIEVGGERAVRQVVDDLEAGALDERAADASRSSSTVCCGACSPGQRLPNQRKVRAVEPRHLDDQRGRPASAPAAPSAGCAADRSRARGSATSSRGRTARTPAAPRRTGRSGTRRRGATGATTDP